MTKRLVSVRFKIVALGAVFAASALMGVPASPVVVAGQEQQLPQASAQQVSVPVGVLDPATLPAAEQASLQAIRQNPVRSPNPNRRSLDQQGMGQPGPDFDRSDYPGAAAPSAAPPAPAPPAVNFNFNGLSQNGFIPPDQALTAGPNHIVEMVNSDIQVFNKNGTSALGPFSLQTWFFTPTNFVFDPVGTARKGTASAGDGLRFYEVALYLNGADSRIVVAASANNSGTSARCVYHFPGVHWGANTFSDFPKVGVTRDPVTLTNSRLLIGVNGFTLAGAFVGNAVLEINRQNLDTCVAAGFGVWTGFSDANDNSMAFTPVPAVDYDESGGYGFYVLFSRFGSGSGHTVWRNRFGVGWERYFVDTVDYTNPPAATQTGTTVKIDTIDSRLQSAVLRYGKTWVVHAVALGGCGAGLDTAVLHYSSIDTPKTSAVPALSTGPSPGNPGLDFYQLGPCATHQYNGAISQDSHGNALYVYTESGTSGAFGYPHPRMNGFHLVENAVGSPVVVGAPPCACNNTTGRWGDYSAAALDPLDQRFIWVASEIMLATNFWGTRIARVLWSGSSI